ncbi:MAG: FAD-binding oxidoreductase [Pirellulales bacterium]
MIDHATRDLTITVEAGITIGELQKILAKENQELPIDVPLPEQATLGGAIACDASGPRRYGRGTLRDYLIGVTAIDGEGRLFRAGGRVVKNVAGYDFCRLLIGSHGMLGIVMQATLKVVPRAETSAAVTLPIEDWERLGAVLDQLAESTTRPVAIEALGGPHRDAALAESAHGVAALCVLFEGSRPDVEWQVQRLQDELRDSAPQPTVLGESAFRPLLAWLRDCDCHGDDAFAVRVQTRPSRVVDAVRTLLDFDPGVSWRAHAGNGVVTARLSREPDDGFATALRDRLRPKLAEQDALVIPLRFPPRAEFTHAALWGHTGDANEILRAIRDQFDPQRRLNPGRF